MADALNSAALDQLFTEARTANSWSGTPVGDDLITRLYDLLKMGPTSANCSPGRYLFIKSDAAKARLKPFLMEGNVDKVMAAPVTVIIGYDRNFPDHMPFLFPHNPDAKHWFDDAAVRQDTAFRNGTLQGAYLMLAARALGLDCGPMSGFDVDGVTAEFFAGTTIQANFLCSLGVMTTEGLFPRSPRFSFDQVAEIL